MAERYGTDLAGLGGFEGGVTSENGAALVSTSSDGETSLLFGSAALREIQAGVANGDFAISPDDSTGTITEENPLPYWTWTPTALITAAITTDATVGSTKVFKVSCAAASNLQTAYLTRFIPVASSGDRGKTYVPLFRFGAATGASAVINVRCRYYQQDQTTAVGTEFYAELASGTQTAIPSDLQYATIPSDAAFLKITIEFKGTILANTSILQEVRALSGDSFIFLTESTPSADGPGQITVQDTPARFKFNKGIRASGASVFDSSVQVASLTSTGAITSTGLLTASANATVVGDLTVNTIMTSANIASGLVNVTPVANTSTGVAVTGLSVRSSNVTAGLSDFSVVVSANSAADTVRTTTYSNLTFSGATLTGITARVFRTNTTITGVSWIAIGR